MSEANGAAIAARPSRVTDEAERLSAAYTCLTPAEVAATYYAGPDGKPRVSADTVRSWMADGLLCAIDVSAAGAKRATYVTRPEWVEEFIARRRNDAA